MFKSQSIKVKMNIALVLVVLLSIGTLTLVSLYHVDKSWVDENRRQVLQQVTLMNQEIDLYIKNITENTKMLSEFPTIKRVDDQITSYVDLEDASGKVDMIPGRGSDFELEVYNVLKTFQDNHSSVKNASVGVESNGGFIKSPPSPRFNGYDARERAWYQAALENPGQVVIPGIYQTSSNEQVILSVTTIQNQDEQVVGVVSVDFDLKDLSDILKNVTIRQSGYVIVTDSQGRIVGHPKAGDMIGRDVHSTALNVFMKGLEIQEGYEEVVLEGKLYDVQSISSDLNGIRLNYFALIEKNELRSSVNRLFKDLTVTALIMIFIASMISRLLANKLSKPLVGLDQATEKIILGDFSFRVEVKSDDEIGHLSKRFNAMADSIQASKENLEDLVDQRTSDLSKANEELLSLNQELEMTLGLLKDTQNQLIQSERTAAMGSMVSGVAHELNTPLGTAVTTLSYFEKLNQTLEAAIKDNRVGRSFIHKYVKDSKNAFLIINSALADISSLLRQFIEVSKTSIGHKYKRINIKNLITDVLNEEALNLKGYQVLVDCPDSIQTFVDKEALAKVLTEFVDNTLEHAYGQEDIKTIAIHVEEDQHYIFMTYRDYGQGISKDHVDRIFDPFYTSKRSHGSLGLGLNLAHNIVKNILRGSIDVKSPEEGGVEYHLSWPK